MTQVWPSLGDILAMFPRITHGPINKVEYGAALRALADMYHKQPIDPVRHDGMWALGTRVRKTKGSSWQGAIVGFYSTSLTPVGYAVESEREPGSVQIYPQSALEVLEA